MKRSTPLPELLSPAGSFEALVAAVEGGADAVYLGGKSYGARAFAENFDTEQLARAVRYAHLHGVRVYVTVNVLLHDRELSACLSYVRELYALGVDAVIVADVGLVQCIREALPDMEIHASTQMSIHNTAGAELAYEMGVSRAVVARELPFKDVCAIVDGTRAELEVFVHGALCVCHSGQCLFSSLVGGRSGNRGECAQPCRLPYNRKNTYPLSLCDLSLSHHIKELVASGVASLKIEGRMKSPDYVWGVTRIYRTLLDECRDSTQKEDKALCDLFSRGGRFTDAYFTGRLDLPMTGVRTDADKQASRTEEGRTFSPVRHPVRARARFRLGEPSQMVIFDENKEVCVTGEIPAGAQNSPLTIDDLQTRLCKMGATFLSLDKNDVEIELDDGINLPPSAINALRRCAAEKFEDCTRGAPPAFVPRVPLGTHKENRRTGERMRTAMFYRTELLDAVEPRALDGLHAIFVPLFCERWSERANGVALPPVVFPSEWERVREKLLSVAKRVRYVMVENLSHLALIRGTGLIPIGSHRLNITNTYTYGYYRQKGLSECILSPELTLAAHAAIGGGAITVGRIPLMITERCFVRASGGCRACGSFVLSDRKGKRFPVLREWEHRNLIFNAVPTYMGDRREGLRGICAEHMIFSTESVAECTRLLLSYQKGASLSYEVRRIKP